MTKVWWTSDWHINHHNLMRYRPFRNVDENTETHVENHNKVVGEKDKVYYLGDIFWYKRDMEEILEHLNGVKYFIIGNHDSRFKKEYEKYGVWVKHFKTIKVEGQKISMMHYPMRSWPASHYGSWQLHGHTHGMMRPLRYQYDVSSDANNFTPVCFEDVKVEIEKRIGFVERTIRRIMKWKKSYN